MVRKIHKKKEKIEGWYSRKPYPHFDQPLPFEAAKRIVSNPKAVAHHPFFPLISYDKKVRRYRGHKDRSVKTRPIKYASHRDGYIYSFYAYKISSCYEDRITKLGLERNVIAYRKGLGNNVDFAQEAFDEIDRRGNCTAIALDISGFFDSIDHEKLKQEWCHTIGEARLPDDHFAVYKSLTRWAEVDRGHCYERLDLDHKKIPSPICDDKTFRTIVKGRGSQYDSLIKVNNENYGIPQGSPMSALLSNIYMIPFDLTMQKLANEIGGHYRRYSDDILWICETQNLERVKDEVDRALEERGSQLIRKEEKTDVSVFEKEKA